MKRLKLIMTNIFFLAVFSLGTARIMAQSVNQATIAGMKTYTITSGFNEKSYQLYVSLPKTYSGQDSVRYPVLYVLDGKFSFNCMSSIREVLDLGKEIKDIIIVAIDGTGVTNAEWLASRYNDFTPSAVLQADTFWSKIMNVPEGMMKSGGAASFLNTLERDIIPFVDKQYKTTADRGLSGHSLGGLFAGYCLLKRPGIFKRYGINSPSLWWNNSEMLRDENYFANQHTELPATVFFSIGGLEDVMMLTPFNGFTSSIKNHTYKGLKMYTQTFDGETHLSVVAACSSRTLKVLYGVAVK